MAAAHDAEGEKLSPQAVEELMKQMPSSLK
jgi:hypothetical protein